MWDNNIRDHSFLPKSEEQEKVEILLASYNGAKYIQEQLDSILSQTYKNIFITILDDASSDETIEIIKRYIEVNPSKISLKVHSKNQGIINTFSTLLSLSSANYVMCSDQDDIWLPHKVEETMKKMIENEKKLGKAFPILIHTDLIIVDERLNKLDDSFWNYINIDAAKGQNLNRLLVQNIVTGCTMLMNRSLISLAVPFPQNILMHDWWIALIACSLGKIDYVQHPTLLYRQHRNNSLGAKKYNLFIYIKRFLSKKERSKREKLYKGLYEQAEYLYSKTAGENCRYIIRAFIDIYQQKFLNKRFSMIKYKFFPQGLLRIFFQFFNLISFTK